MILFAALFVAGFEYKDIASTQCNMDNISFSKKVMPLFQQKCSTATCHGKQKANALPFRNYAE
ncbi:MAG: hypothetical protein ACKODM_11835, partial [Cytophagales bacterium]